MNSTSSSKFRGSSVALKTWEERVSGASKLLAFCLWLALEPTKGHVDAHRTFKSDSHTQPHNGQSSSIDPVAQAPTVIFPITDIFNPFMQGNELVVAVLYRNIKIFLSLDRVETIYPSRLKSFHLADEQVT